MWLWDNEFVVFTQKMFVDSLWHLELCRVTEDECKWSLRGC